MTDYVPDKQPDQGWRECPDCHGVRKPCKTCNGRRAVPGKPQDEAERGRVAIIRSIQRDGLRATYDRFRGRK